MPAECPVCLEPYDLSEKKPKVLRCSHSVCSSCLKSITHGDSVECPTCRSPTDTKDVNTNYGLMDAIEGKCGACSEQASTKECLHCSQNVCEGCFEAHSIELHSQVKKEMDNLRQLIGSATIRSLDQSILEREAQREEETIMRIRNTAQTQRNEVERVEREMIRKREATSELNIQKISEWMNNLELQLDECRSFVRGSQRNVGLKYTAQCTMSQMEEIHKSVERLTFNLHLKQQEPSSLTEYNFAESNRSVSAIGEIACHSKGGIDYTRVKSKTVAGGQGNKLAQFNDCARLACIGDYVIATDDNNHRFKVYDCNLDVVCVVGEEGKDDNQFNFPRGICTVGYELFITDASNHRIKVYDKHWQVVRIFGSLGSGENNFDCPLGIAGRPEGTLFVCDSENYTVKVLGLDGKFVRRIGSKGTGPGQFPDRPQRVAVTSDGIVLVRDYQATNIHMFKTNGEFIRLLLKGIPNTPTRLAFRGFVLDQEDNVILTDTDNHRLVVLSKTGEFQCTIGEQGELIQPLDVTLDKNSDLIVYERGSHRLQIFEVGRVSQL